VNTTGNRNVAVGNETLASNVTGSSCSALGYRAGFALTTGDENICIGAGVLGVAAESAVTRIGATATMTRCYIGGIYGTISTRADNTFLIIDSHGQVGTLGPLTDGQLLIGSTGANPVAATLTPGSGILITNGAGGITIASTGGSGLTWSAVTASATASVNQAYVGTSGTVTILLPTVSALGDIVIISLTGGNQISFGQSTGQSIQLGNMITTPGTVGSISSIASGNLLNIVCVTANTDWLAQAAQGNWDVV
jgi:hypothetical protein